MNPTLHDEQGNEIKPPQCKCGKVSDTCLMGVTNYIWMCNECLDLNGIVPVKMVYNLPDMTSERYIKAAKMLAGYKRNIKEIVDSQSQS